MRGMFCLKWRRSVKNSTMTAPRKNSVTAISATMSTMTGVSRPCAMSCRMSGR